MACALAFLVGLLAFGLPLASVGLRLARGLPIAGEAESAMGDRIVFPDKSGLTTVVAADRDFRALAESDLGEPIFASPAPVGDRLYLRTTRHLWCVEGQD